jgi:hypothetical protein
MKWIKTEYLDSEALYNTWFEVDQPLLVVFHNDKVQLSRDFIRQLEYLVTSGSMFDKLLVICMQITKEDEPNLIKEYKVNRYPALIVFDGREVDRINDVMSTEDLGKRIRP